MKSRWVVAVVLAVLAAAGATAWWVLRSGGDDEDGFTLKSKGGASVLISAPKPDAVVSSPLHVKGKVPGSWSFEANFGVELLDANHKPVATTYATVQGNWMTEKDVTFTALVPFKPPSTKSGYLVLHKANPSDSEGEADSVEIPIRFK